MPTGVYPRTKEHLTRLAEQGKRASQLSKGKPLSQEGREKLLKVGLKTRFTSVRLMGHIVTEETRKKISQAHTGMKMPRESVEKMRLSKIGKPSHRKGMFHTDETKSSISKNRKGKLLGPKHHQWKGGISEDKQHYCRERRVRKMNAVGSHTLFEWGALKIQNKDTCLCCKRKEPEIKLTEDHIVPLARGGTDFIENIQPLCRSCNSKKHAKTINYKTT